MDNDLDAGQEMVEELGINPGANVDDRQRFELLRKWHQEEPKQSPDSED